MAGLLPWGPSSGDREPWLQPESLDWGWSLLQPGEQEWRPVLYALGPGGGEPARTKKAGLPRATELGLTSCICHSALCRLRQGGGPAHPLPDSILDQSGPL